MSDMDNLAGAITEAFLNADADENITDAVNRLARAITNLGNADAATPMGGMEALGKAMTDSADRIAAAIERLAEAVEGANQ
jgi:hypothetical protein